MTEHGELEGVLANSEPSGDGQADSDRAATTPDASVAPWEPRKVRLGPAAIILGIVAFVSIGGFALALIGSGHPHSQAAVAGGVNRSGLVPVRSGGLIARIESNGNPPPDIIASVVLPQSATLSGTLNSDRGIGLYDRSLVLQVPSSMSEVVEFYKTELVRFGWKIAGADATSSGGETVYATRASSDGYYWEIGAVVVPVNPAITPALGGGDEAPTSTLTLRMFEIDDAD